MSLTDKSVLDTTSDMSIRIKCDKENHVLSITDTGVGMTKQDLITNLGKQEFCFLLFIPIFSLPTYLSQLRHHSSTTPAKRWVGGWGQKVVIFADLQHYLCCRKWVGGPKKAKNLLT